MIDAGGVLLVGAADAVLRALLGQLVAGVDSQVAFDVAAGGDRLAAMRLRFAVLVAGFHAAAELVDAAGVVETAADLGLLGVRGGFIVGRRNETLLPLTLASPLSATSLEPLKVTSFSASSFTLPPLRVEARFSVRVVFRCRGCVRCANRHGIACRRLLWRSR